MSSTMTLNEDDDESASDNNCKLCWRIPLPQNRCTAFFLRPVWLLTLLTASNFLSGMVVNGFVNVYVSTLERRFHLKSKQTGLVVSAFDIGSILSVVPASYLGRRRSKVKFIALGLFIFGSGSFLFSLPHFLSPTYMTALNETAAEAELSTSLCTVEEKMACPAEDAEEADTLWLFFLGGQILHGVGSAPMMSLGTTLLDELTEKNGPIYIAVFQAGNLVGSAAGFVAGGAFLQIYTDFMAVDAEYLDASSPLWVGAWWLGFVVSWIVAFVIGFCISLYPRVRMSKLVQDGQEDVGNFLKALKKIFTNLTLVFIMACSAMEAFSIGGIAAFIPKYLESQFSLTSTWAAILVGVTVVPAGGLGFILGGYVTKRLELGVVGAIKVYLLCQAIAIPVSLFFLLSCPNPPFCGVNVVCGNATNAGDDFSYACNAHCACSPYDFSPVCGSDGRTYFSPCYAGCSNVALTDCTCVASASSESPCEADCEISVAVAAIFIYTLFTFAGMMPVLMAVLRSVQPQSLRSLALGVESVVRRCLGAIPGPVVFGVLVDGACALWQRQCHDEDQDRIGNCLLYDNDSMGLYLMAANVAFKTLAVLFMLAAFRAAGGNFRCEKVQIREKVYVVQ